MYIKQFPGCFGYIYIYDKTASRKMNNMATFSEDNIIFLGGVHLKKTKGNCVLRIPSQFPKDKKSLRSRIF
jgi:hypothetical protein